MCACSITASLRRSRAAASDRRSVLHLERLGYVERVPDPSDRRAKLVRATPKGRQLYAIAREVVAEIDADWTKRLGKTKMRQLRALLAELDAAL